MPWNGYMGELHRVSAALCIWLLVTGVQVVCIVGQGAFNVLGYVCDPSNTTAPCETYAYYRVNAGQTLEQIGALFQKTPAEIAAASKISVSFNETLPEGEPLLIPLKCTCDSLYNVSGSLAGSYYQDNTTYKIQNGDYYAKVVNETYDNLATWQAVNQSNPTLEPTNLSIGDTITVPVRCACLKPGQDSLFLLTYVIGIDETLEDVASQFNVLIDDLRAENGLLTTDIIYYSTSLLVPLRAVPRLFWQEPPSAGGSSPPPSGSVTSGNSSSKSNAGLIAGVIVAALVLLVVGLLVVLVLLRRRRWRPRDKEYQLDGDFESIPSRSTATGTSDGKSSLAGDVLLAMSDMVGADRPILFTYEDLKEATDNFSHLNKIQGSVYYGTVNGNTVAIKQMKGNMTQELKILFQVHHSSLVKLLGVCGDSSSEHVYLVYEYAENGSLADCLRNHLPLGQGREAAGHEGSSAAFLSWNTRLKIALDVATGLEYIHEYITPAFIHKDIKSSNILLDAKLHAKIANFGMAKLGVTEAVLTRHIHGTYGYMAPEYLAHGLVSTKIDVFAFGVVLLELLSGREAVVRIVQDTLEEREVCLSDMIGPILDSPNPRLKLQGWMDPVLGNAYPLDAAHSVATLARSCVNEDPHKRPSMKDIAFTLSKMLVTSLEWEASGVVGLPELAAQPVEDLNNIKSIHDGAGYLLLFSRSHTAHLLRHSFNINYDGGLLHEFYPRLNNL